MDRDVSPIRLNAIEFRIRTEPLAIPSAFAEPIAADWAKSLAANPTLFNGSAFLFDRIDIDAANGTLVADGAPTDYSTFLYWRQHRDEMGFNHAFPVGAIVTSDKKLIVGRMSQHTSNPGKHYPPSGSFDTSDLQPEIGGIRLLDPLANIEREIAEEIGLDAAQLVPDPDWLLLPSTPSAHAIIKVLRSAETSGALGPGLRRHIAEDPHQELEDVLFVDFGFRFADGSANPYVNHLLAYLERTG